MLDLNNILSKYIKSNEKIILACSTWPDSMFLFYEIIKSDFKNNLVVCYFNHNLRPESKKEEDFLRNLQKKYNFTLEIWSEDILELQKESISISIEELARQKRYDFLRNIKKKYNSKIIITWHHLDDKIETFLFNLARWSKLSWLINMTLISGDILRPLINIQKKEIQNFLDKNKLEYMIDKSNFSNDYTRNYIRNDILPKFEYINKNYKQNISNTLQYFEDLKYFIDDEIKKIINREKQYFLISEFNIKSDFLKKEIIRYIYYITNNNSTIWLSSSNIQEVIKFINSRWNKTIKEIKNMKLFKDGDKIIWR